MSDKAAMPICCVKLQYSVESLCRDTVDMQYILIQRYLPRNLKNGLHISLHDNLLFNLECFPGSQCHENPSRKYCTRKSYPYISIHLFFTFVKILTGVSALRKQDVWGGTRLN